MRWYHRSSSPTGPLPKNSGHGNMLYIPDETYIIYFCIVHVVYDEELVIKPEGFMTHMAL